MTTFMRLIITQQKLKKTLLAVEELDEGDVQQAHKRFADRSVFIEQLTRFAFGLAMYTVNFVAIFFM